MKLVELINPNKRKQINLQENQSTPNQRTLTHILNTHTYDAHE